MQSEVWAAWVQAIGSVAAIVVAILIPWNQHRHEKKEQDLDRYQQARGLAFLISLDLQMLEKNIEEALRSSTNTVPNFNGFHFDIPEYINSIVCELYIMEDVSELILHLSKKLRGNIHFVKDVKKKYDELIREAGSQYSPDAVQPFLKEAHQCIYDVRNNARSILIDCRHALEAVEELVNSSSFATYLKFKKRRRRSRSSRVS